MAELSFSLDMRPSADELTSRFRFGEKVVTQGQQDLMSRKLGPDLLSLVRAEAPSKTGKFAQGITLKMGGSGGKTSFQIGIPSPLGRWVQEGTKPHVIRPKGPGYPLRFFWAKGPRGPGIYRYMSVNHPGTKANRFVSRAYSKWLPGARRDIRALAQSYVRAVTTGAAAGQFGY